MMMVMMLMMVVMVMTLHYYKKFNWVDPARGQLVHRLYLASFGSALFVGPVGFQNSITATRDRILLNFGKPKGGQLRCLQIFDEISCALQQKLETLRNRCANWYVPNQLGSRNSDPQVRRRICLKLLSYRTSISSHKNSCFAKSDSYPGPRVHSLGPGSLLLHLHHCVRARHCGTSISIFEAS